MKIKYSRDALKFLSKLDKKSVERIRMAIQGLTHSPPIGDVKPLQGIMTEESGCVSAAGASSSNTAKRVRSRYSL